MAAFSPSPSSSIKWASRGDLVQAPPPMRREKGGGGGVGPRPILPPRHVLVDSFTKSQRATSRVSQEPWPWDLWEPKRKVSDGRPNPPCVGWLLYKGHEGPLHAWAESCDHDICESPKEKCPRPSQPTMCWLTPLQRSWRATSHVSQEPWPWDLWEPKRKVFKGRPKPPCVGWLLYKGHEVPLHARAKSRDHEVVRAQKKSVRRPSQTTMCCPTPCSV